MKLFRDPRKSKKAVEPAAPEQDRWSSLSAESLTAPMADPSQGAMMAHPNAAPVSDAPAGEPERPRTPRPDMNSWSHSRSNEMAPEAPASQSPVQPQVVAPAAQPARGTPDALRPMPVAQAASAQAAPAPAPAAPASAPRGRGNRVKTRLLGFDRSDGSSEAFDASKAVVKQKVIMNAVGWIIVVDGPGRGACFPLLSGMSQIGRDDDQQIQLDFGDSAISRTNHAAIAYDTEGHQFFFGHGGKSNIVRLNGAPVVSKEILKHGDHISIGETELRLVVLCDSEFNWNEEVKDEDPEASAQDSDEFILKSGTSEKTPHEAAPANQAAPNAASQADRSEE